MPRDGYERAGWVFTPKGFGEHMATPAPAPAAAPSLVSSLTNAAVNISALREAAWLDLEALLADVPGRICLVIDSSLEGLLKMCVTGGAPQLKVSFHLLNFLIY